MVLIAQRVQEENMLAHLAIIVQKEALTRSNVPLEPTTMTITHSIHQLLVLLAIQTRTAQQRV
jgi:hypothetical protein